ncbi:MAG: hypothetical protein S4CHLAM123_07530 [Chlamydiales bacterium]|nr:hypothetical protein [Chlamydiales bacterium]
MHNELIQLGSFIQKSRENKGLTLKEVENFTSIRLAYLQAIEEGHFGKLISPVYAQGFINKYVHFLELDPNELFKQYPYVLQVLNDKSSSSDFSLGLGSLEVRGSPGGEVKWLPNLVWVGASVLAILAGWFIARSLGLF